MSEIKHYWPPGRATGFACDASDGFKTSLRTEVTCPACLVSLQFGSAAKIEADETNDQQLIRLASEREGRINDLTDRVSLLERQLDLLERQLENERLHRARVEADAHAARKSLIRLRKVLKRAYLTALEAGK